MWTDFIEKRKDTVGGKPIIKNTRISVALVLEKAGAGETVQQLMLASPHLTKNEILACFAYCACVLCNESYLH
jgi:uncharacterized protein (DUF433 family)